MRCLISILFLPVVPRSFWQRVCRPQCLANSRVIFDHGSLLNGCAIQCGQTRARFFMRLAAGNPSGSDGPKSKAADFQATVAENREGFACNSYNCKIMTPHARKTQARRPAVDYRCRMDRDAGVVGAGRSDD